MPLWRSVNMGKDLKGKELGKGILQRKNGRYCGRYVDIFGERKYIYNNDLRALKKELKEVIYETEQGTAVVDSSIKLSSWFEKWLLVYKQDIIRENTKRHYVQIFSKHIEPRLGNFRLVDITQLQCKEMINTLKQNGYQWETQNKVRVLMIDMFNRALQDQFVKRNPMKGVRLASNKPNERKVLTVDEQALFYECCAGTFYDNLFVVAVNTGLRPGELFALTWDDIDFNKREISITKTLVYQKYLTDEVKTFHLEPPKTESSIRCVPINNECERALKKQFVQKQIIQKRGVKKHEFSDRLFVTQYNTPLNSVLYSDAIHRIIAEINLMKDDLEQIEKFAGHTFRHTFATRCIESGVAPKIVQAYLGHASLTMTMDLYVHATDEYKQEEMDKLSASLENIKITDNDIEQSYNKAQEFANKIVHFA